MDQVPDIEVPPECSRDLILGQVVQAVNCLTATNKEDHDKIFARLDEGDKYLFVFKASRCTFDWLNRNGFLKWGLVGSLFAALGWLVGYFQS